MKSHQKIGFFVASAAVLGLMFSVASRTSHAAVIAVVDSGTDLQHPDLQNKMWHNPGEIDNGVDDDDNGYVDDLYGWNFPDDTNRLVDRKLIGTWPADDFKYFQLQTKALLGQATEEEIAWLKAKVKDQAFIAQLEAFANHVHGTHVAGISAKDADHAEIMVLRLIGGGQPSSFLGTLEAVRPSPADGHGIINKLIYLALDGLAAAQGQGLAPVGAYIADKKAVLANCSFGASRASIEPLIRPIIEKLLGSPLTDAQIHVYSDYFLTQTNAAMKAAFVDPSKGKTLFVIAAGNDGTDNDVAPTAPANIRAANTITVAATLGRERMASFSNFGATKVDIAAPGVGITSTIPGGGYMQVSGTSQATPFVTNIAGRIMDTNSKLTVAEVKKILMQTVDKKDFLVKKVVSEGIANSDRALYAAKLSLTMAVDDAIAHSNNVVADVKEISGEHAMDESGITVLPLPSFIR